MTTQLRRVQKRTVSKTKRAPKRATRKSTSRRSSARLGGRVTRRAAARTGARAGVSQGPPDHILVFVPGFMGSQLRDKTTGELVWLDFSQATLNPLNWEPWFENIFNKMLYPNPNLEPAGIIQDVLFAPPWVKQEQYSRLLAMLAKWGYRVDPARYPEEQLNVYTFAYDWRQDNRITGRQLAEAVERWRALHPGAQVWLMGHSNGGIVSRWYIEKEGGKDVVSRLILLASPWDGAAKAVYMLFQGFAMLFRRRFNLLDIPRRTREALRTFPSAYQLIPQSRNFLSGPGGEPIDPFIGENWLPRPEQWALLQDGRRFNQELGNNLSVDTVAFFGRKLLTTTGGKVVFDGGTRWERIDWQETETGDGTLAEYTAVFPTTNRNIPIIAGHGDIYVNPALVEILRWELLDKYRGLSTARAAAVVKKLAVTFSTDRDVYAPGEEIQLVASLHRVPGDKPIVRAAVNAKLAWLQALPGAEGTRPRRLPSVALTADKGTRGQFVGSLTAPKSEGYYDIQATITLPSGEGVELSTMIAVERE